jgi:hypothetical protein
MLRRTNRTPEEVSMRKLVFAVCFAFLFAVGAQAQGKIASQWNCGKATDAHSIEVGDQAGHMFVVSQSKCSAVKGEIGGVQEKEGTSTDFNDVMGDKSSLHGVFVETLANGDRVYVSYKGSGTSKGGQFVSGNDTWTITGGTGKLKGIKGKGTCKGKGNPDGSATWDCEGTYEVAAAPEKKM